MTEHAQSNESIRNSEVDSPSTGIISWGSPKEIFMVISLALLTGFLLKIPMIFGVDDDAYFPRNIGSILLPALLGYSLFVSKLVMRLHWSLLAVAGILVLYINLLPGTLEDSALYCVLSYPHSCLVYVCKSLPRRGLEGRYQTNRFHSF